MPEKASRARGGGGCGVSIFSLKCLSDYLFDTRQKGKLQVDDKSLRAFDSDFQSWGRRERDGSLESNLVETGVLQICFVHRSASSGIELSSSS